VLLGQARPEGLAAVVYHGLLGGIRAIGAMIPVPAGDATPPVITPAAAPSDPALLRLLANMVLHYTQESAHVI
jgi:hypothetical protein